MAQDQPDASTIYVVWEENPRGGVKASHDGVIIFPSKVGFIPSSGGTCRARLDGEEPAAGQRERCTLYLNATGNSYFAYPDYLRIETHHGFHFISTIDTEVTVIRASDSHVEAYLEGETIVIRVTPQ